MIWILNTIFLLAKIILFANINKKVLFYIPLIFFVSTVTDLYPFPDSYLNYKNNLLNRDFMKLSYYWSLVVLLPFLLITVYTYTLGNLFSIVLNCSRSFLLIFTCRFIRRQFYIIEQAYSYCSREASVLKSEDECTAQGYTWIEFSLSGHTFYMFYCSLVIMEEVKLYKIWESLEKISSFENFAGLKNLNKDQLLHFKYVFLYFNGFMKVWLVFMAVIVFLLDFSTVSTLVYFHQLDEKLFGGILAIGAWYIEYRLLFGKIIECNINRFCNEESNVNEYELENEKYSFEMRRLLYYKPLPNYTPFSQLHYNV